MRKAGCALLSRYGPMALSEAPHSWLCYLLPFKRGYMLLSLLFVRIHAQHTEESPNALNRCRRVDGER